MRKTALLLSSVCSFALSSGAFAEEKSTTETHAPYLHTVASSMSVIGGSGNVQWQFTPTYSELFGLGLHATAGGYVTDNFAVGGIIDFGEFRNEYLANAGFRLSDSLQVVGSVGILKERQELVLGEGLEEVQQLEYGLSLKGNFDAGVFRGFELNAYHTKASGDSDNAETGDLAGLQAVSQLKPADSTSLRLGAGYERADWAGGEAKTAFSFRADGVQELTDKLSANAYVKLGASENIYGGGLAYSLGDGANTNIVGLNYEYIEGQHGTQNDQRIELSWRMGLGFGPNSSSSGNGSKPSGESKSFHVDQYNAPANALISDVLKRPEFLPKRVLMRPVGNGECPFYTTDQSDNRVNAFYSNFAFNGVFMFSPNDINYPSSIQLGTVTLVWVGQKIPQTSPAGGIIYQYEATPVPMNGIEALTIPGYPACSLDLLNAL